MQVEANVGSNPTRVSITITISMFMSMEIAMSESNVSTDEIQDVISSIEGRLERGDTLDSPTARVLKPGPHCPSSKSNVENKFYCRALNSGYLANYFAARKSGFFKQDNSEKDIYFLAKGYCEPVVRGKDIILPKGEISLEDAEAQLEERLQEMIPGKRILYYRKRQSIEPLRYLAYAWCFAEDYEALAKNGLT